MDEPEAFDAWPPALVAALDAWIGERAASLTPERLTRLQAVQRLTAEALQAMGLYPVGQA